MKRFLCILTCLLLLLTGAAAEEGNTPVNIFRKQFIVGGFGFGGTVYVSASGVAPWLDVILPFTGAKLQLRAIGESQGEMIDQVGGNDRWQAKMYTKDAQGEVQGLTYLYGDAEAIYLKSDLLPDTLLTAPVKDVHIPYQLVDQEFLSLLTAFDPMGLMVPQADGNVEAYSALAALAQISDEEWASDWEPVLEKYYTEIDMWLSAYGAAPEVSGATGNLTMKSAYKIPAEDLKAEAKYLIGLMMYDYELQALLVPHFTDEQRMIYLNPSLVYFYEYCIDMLPLNGSIYLEREVTAMGETISTSVSMPVPALPEELTAPLSEKLAEVFALPYNDILSDVQSLSYQKAGGDVSISIASPSRTISFIVDENVSNAETQQVEGFVRITPAPGNVEAPLSAAFTYKTSHRIWEDDEWVMHEDTSMYLSIEPDTSLMDADDPFRSSYIDFPALLLDATVNYSQQTDMEGRPVKLAVDIRTVLPDAEVSITASLKTAEKWAHEDLPTEGAEDMTQMDDARRDALLAEAAINALEAMTPAVPETTQDPVQ